MLVEIAVGGSRPQLCPDCTPWVPPDMTECEHGGLKRKCRVCELEAENAELKREIEDLDKCYQDYRQAVSDACTPEHFLFIAVKFREIESARKAKPDA